MVYGTTRAVHLDGAQLFRIRECYLIGRLPVFVVWLDRE
jgi:hypothetical protein